MSKSLYVPVPMCSSPRVRLWLGVTLGHEGRFRRDPLPVFSAGGSCEQFWHRQINPLFNVVHLALPLTTTASPTLQGAPKDGFGEAVVACDMPEPWKSPSYDSCQKRFLWTHKEAALSPATSRWSCAPSRRYGKVSSCPWFRKPGSFFSESTSRVHVSQP